MKSDGGIPAPSRCSGTL